MDLVEDLPIPVLQEVLQVILLDHAEDLKHGVVMDSMVEVRQDVV